MIRPRQVPGGWLDRGSADRYANDLSRTWSTGVMVDKARWATEVPGLARGAGRPGLIEVFARAARQGNAHK